MNGQFKFRTALFGGFKRRDVISYIQRLMTELEDCKRAIAEQNRVNSEQQAVLAEEPEVVADTSAEELSFAEEELPVIGVPSATVNHESEMRAHISHPVLEEEPDISEEESVAARIHSAIDTPDETNDEPVAVVEDKKESDASPLSDDIDALISSYLD